MIKRIEDYDQERQIGQCDAKNSLNYDLKFQFYESLFNTKAIMPYSL